MSDDKRWTLAWNEFRNRLRDTCPRYTETRAIHTLPVQLFVQTGHVREAQWLSGSSLQHSKAAGHYYAAPAHELARTYVATLRAMGIDAKEPEKIDESYVGAARTASRWNKAANAVRELVTDTEDSVRLSKAPLDHIAAGVYALGTYLALIFGVCTAHRFTASIGNVTR